MKYSLGILSALLLLLCSCSISVHHPTPPAPLSLVSQPRSVEVSEGSIVMNEFTPLSGNNEQAATVATQFAELVHRSGNWSPSVRIGEAAVGEGVVFALSSSYDLPEEGYRIHSTPEYIQVEASTEAGLYYGMQTLLQLFPPAFYTEEVSEWSLPLVTISNSPRFRWRGLHLDVARHMMPVAFIKDYLDWMAAHKLNRFHWHLTDDQGWRIEIPSYPLLTSIGSQRSQTLVGILRQPEPLVYDGIPHGGFYTQEDIREIVDYAAQRHIVIIPEMSMPGHATAALAAYPSLGGLTEAPAVGTHWGIYPQGFVPSPETFDFLDNVLAEVATLFPGPYIHLGGDEAVMDPALYQLFMSRMAETVRKLNKVPLGWDEALSSLGPDGITTLRWSLPAAGSGSQVIVADQQSLFFDYAEHYPSEFISISSNDPLHPTTPLQEVFELEVPDWVLGIQGQVWTEYMPTPEDVHRMLFPRIAALAERSWSTPSSRSWEEFASRSLVHLVKLEQLMSLVR